MNHGYDYLMLCRECFFLQLFPASPGVKTTEQYQRLKKIVTIYFTENKLDDFAGFLAEGHYLVQLWTAHFIIEYGDPDLNLKKSCIQLIKEYTDNPLAPDVAEQEKLWLDHYYRYNSHQ
jgi:hypothetical protein